MSTHHYVFLGSDGHSGWTQITNIADTRLDFLGSKYCSQICAPGHTGRPYSAPDPVTAFGGGEGNGRGGEETPVTSYAPTRSLAMQLLYVGAGNYVLCSA